MQFRESTAPCFPQRESGRKVGQCTQSLSPEPYPLPGTYVYLPLPDRRPAETRGLTDSEPRAKKRFINVQELGWTDDSGRFLVPHGSASALPTESDSLNADSP
ncbi:MAG: hypothetical protein JWP08_4294, partial [Bryobacterales bacterium]|nr:hypothetical protein [Bryobacterales bacterium]